MHWTIFRTYGLLDFWEVECREKCHFYFVIATLFHTLFQKILNFYWMSPLGFEKERVHVITDPCMVWEKRGSEVQGEEKLGWRWEGGLWKYKEKLCVEHAHKNANDTCVIQYGLQYSILRFQLAVQVSIRNESRLPMLSLLFVDLWLYHDNFPLYKVVHLICSSVQL